MCNANAQPFIIPTMPEAVLPLASDFAVKEKITNTSSYSYEDVNFNVSSTATPDFEPMDLYVYSWNSGAVNGHGISFIRVNSTTGVVEHKGFVFTDPKKSYTEVGILQDDDDNTYVIAAWTGYVEGLDVGGLPELKPGTFYDIYKWKHDGLYLESEANPLNYYFNTVSNSNIARRVSMDCSELNKVVFCWEEAYTSTYNPGGIFLKVLRVNGTAPPFEVTPIFYMPSAGSGLGLSYPDVAFGVEAQRVRVAYRTPTLTPSIFDLNVRSSSFATMASYPFASPTATSTYLTLISSLPYVFDDIKSGLINEVVFPYVSFTNVNDQISLDCPDRDAPDVWAVVVGTANNNIKAVLKYDPNPAIPAIVKDLTSSTDLKDKNINPVVSFQNQYLSQGITFAWYHFGYDYYVATQTDILGNYINPVSPSVFFQVSNHPAINVIRDAMRPTMSRNNIVKRGQICAYPFNEATPLAQFDMRAKVVTGPISHFKHTLPELNLDKELTVVAHPNPFKDYVQIDIENYFQEDLSWTISDVSGRVLINGKNMKLYSLNEQIQKSFPSLPSGNYFLEIQQGKDVANLQLIKQ